MKVHNVRLGFACNSSSTHSILVMKQKPNLVDECDSWCYGWDNFTLVSAEEKARYLSQMLSLQLQQAVGQTELGETAKDVVSELFSSNDDPCIDHQSVFQFPTQFHSNEIDWQFLRRVVDSVLDDRCIILGGNDNSDPHPLFDPFVASEWHSFLVESQATDVKVRYDALYDYYTLFKKSNGTKLRVSFRDGDVTRSSSPELVDLKITDYCAYGCKDCYMGSTKKGMHGDTAFIKKVIDDLSEKKVFEVALGGGEPTSHPDFKEIVLYAREKGLVPNVTTRNKDFLSGLSDDPDLCNALGGVAFSVDTLADAEWVIEQKHLSRKLPVISLQMISGVSEDGADIIRLALDSWVRVTVLGYKPVGRGKSYPRYSEDFVTKENQVLMKSVLRDLRWFSCDTKFIRDHIHGGMFMGIPFAKETFQSREGDFSCFIDALTKSISTSSYSGESFEIEGHSLSKFTQLSPF